MGRLKDTLNVDAEDFIDVPEERVYPVKLQVDGYDVNHYYDGDVPVYEVYGADGKIIDVAHSTNEMHEITGNAGVDKDKDCIRFLV